MECFEGRTGLSGFVLVGGSALSLRLSHRLSEDLDLTCLDEVLPRNSLEQTIRKAGNAGLDFSRKDNEAAWDEFLQGGMDLHDYWQDFLAANKVKVSFFTADAAAQKILCAPAEPFVRVATVPELFKLKSIVSARRSKTRDWFDLYTLMTRYSFTLADYFAAFKEGGVDSQAEIGLGRLCSGVPQKDDEGYAHLVMDAPDLNTITKFFNEARDSFEKESASRAFKGYRAKSNQ